MKTSVSLPSSTDPATGGFASSYSDLERWVLDAEELGYREVFFQPQAQFPGSEYGFDAWTVAGAIAGRTRRIRLGAPGGSIRCSNPAFTAKKAATLDYLANGRLTLDFTIDRDHVEETREALVLMKKMFTQSEVTFSGTFFEVQGARCSPAPIQKPWPRIVLRADEGAAGDSDVLRLFAEHADVSMLTDVDPDTAVAHATALSQACSAVGRNDADIERAVEIPVLTMKDGDRSVEAAVPSSADAVQRQSGWSVNPYPIGPANECATKLQAYMDVGLTHLLLRVLDYPRTQTLQWLAAWIADRFPEGGNIWRPDI